MKKITNIPVVEDLGDNISIMNLNIQPFSQEWQPRTTSDYKKSKDFVIWGEKNTYPDFMLETSSKSSLLKGILNKEKTRIFAQGLELIDGTDITTHPLFQVNKMMNINDLTKSIINDYSNISCFSFQNEYSNNGKLITGLYYQPVKNVRCSYMDTDDNIKQFYLSKNWSEWRYKTFTYTSIQNFYTKETNDSLPSLSYIKNNSSIDDYYPEITWESSLDYVLMDNEVSKFHLANIMNGLNPGLIINFNQGDVSDEKKRTLKDKIKHELQGANAAGKMILLFSKDKEHEPTIKQLEVNNADKQYAILNETIDNKILMSTDIPRILSGLETTVGLSDGGKALAEANRVWFNESIKYKQETILKALNDIMIFNNMPLIQFRQNKESIFTSGLSEQTILTLFSIDELRENLGFGPKNNIAQ